MSAFLELMKHLQDGEVVEAVVFGDYGWSGYSEEGLKEPIPKDKRGIVLTLEQAKPYMKCWNFFGGFGAPTSYATYVWTNKRVIWVTQYDGATTLDSMPRNPVNCIPDMPGG